MKGKPIIVSLILFSGLLCVWSSVKAGELNEATKAGDVVKIRQLLEQGADINAKSGVFEWTPLHIAIALGKPYIMKLLIEKGADLEARDRDQRTPLQIAALSGFIENAKIYTNIAKLLIEKGADVNARDTSQSTPLHFAAFRGNVYLAELLIKKGADINATDKNGMTPAKVADWQKHPKTAALIRKYCGK
jgi:ankyrin repeat protein